jgi:hypothetical protein
VSGCGMAAHSETIAIFRGGGVPSNSGVVVMGTDEVTTLHPQETGKSELPTPLEAVSPSSVDSSRIVCSDGNPL